MNKTNPNQKRIICQQYRQGISIDQIAYQNKLSITTIKKYLKQANLFHPAKRNKLSPSQKLQALVMIKQGGSVVSIANKLHVEYHLIYQVKQNYAKSSIRCFKRLNKAQIQEIELDYQNGKSFCYIAKKLNVATSTITRYLNPNKKKSRQALIYMYYFIDIHSPKCTSSTIAN